MQAHHFHAGPHVTHDGRRICEGCGDVEAARVHRVPTVSDEARAVDARKLGEDA